jgi:hypothetical protein
MRSAFHLLIFAMISVSLCHPMTLGAKPITASAKTDCCTQSHAANVADGCKHAPKSNDKECCAGCALCLCAVLSTARIALYPPGAEKGDTAYQLSDRFRSERPPVPPPRSLIPA